MRRMTSAGPSMGDTVHARVVSMIARCELEPGRWITEKEIVALTGFGLAPVRSALGRLRYEGLVEPVPRVGYQVRPLDAADVEDVFDVWEILAPELIRRAYARVSDEDVEAHVAELGDDAAALAPGAARGEEYWRAGRRHAVWIARMSGSPRLESLFQRLSIDLRRCCSLLSRIEGGRAKVLDELPDLLACLRRRDVEVAVEQIRATQAAARRLTLDAVRRAEEIDLWRTEPAVS